MNADEFKQQLEKYAELKQVKTPKSAAIRESEEPEVVYRGGQEFLVATDNNSTLNWAIKKLKPHVAVCEDCHCVVEGRVVETRSYDNPAPHWRKHCKPCGMVQNPYTKQFDVTVKKSHHYYSCWLKKMPEPESYDVDSAVCSDLQAVFKKPAK
jgi:hypothetical protein